MDAVQTEIVRDLLAELERYNAVPERTPPALMARVCRILRELDPHGAIEQRDVIRDQLATGAHAQAVLELLADDPWWSES